MPYIAYWCFKYELKRDHCANCFIYFFSFVIFKSVGEMFSCFIVVMYFLSACLLRCDRSKQFFDVISSMFLFFFFFVKFRFFQEVIPVKYLEFSKRINPCVRHEYIAAFYFFNMPSGTIKNKHFSFCVLFFVLDLGLYKSHDHSKKCHPV